jgi:peptidyl-tRNA hydrolase
MLLLLEQGERMTEQQPFNVLYILMRTDLSSLNPGKGMAQSSHASNAFLHRIDKERNVTDVQIFNANNWRNQTPQGFGTVLVLGVNKEQMFSAVKIASMMGFVAEVVNDPTYPYILDKEAASLVPVASDTAPRMQQGDKTVLFRSEDPSAYVFGDKNDPMLQAILGKFQLHA